MGSSRRRGSELEQAILRAAVEELTESGYVGLTMDGVATRAGTNKNAIYRRWPSRATLALAAYRELIGADREPPDTGTLRGDVLELLRGANNHLSAPAVSGIVLGLLAAAADDPDLMAQLRDSIIDAGSGLWLTVLGRAVTRGEISEKALKPRVATVAIALLRNEYVTRGTSSVPDDILIEIIDDVYLPLLRSPR
ncbi:TetR/AcrR family transcriptional regulator [Winogradskya consettensis]|uniref:TetR family transcriptional regulator n=1 Tax=Winogradskya consettensis TaxID=113560 RepID=A0A919VT44_9ACTN|nr:TetR/AcrR family transcriptional regulator [Actinoplanes consettensis]GIM77874.1 TetR family transcriptional regulator [Actinoplanes consettensis]